jgi:hypothetical protein
MAKYNVYQGKFPCHTCKEIVNTIRSYPENKEATWMCSQKHLSQVSFIKKSKKDYLSE